MCIRDSNEAFQDNEFLSCPALRNKEDRDITSWHLYTVKIDFEALGKTRTTVMAELREAGVGTQVLYIPVHLQPYYRSTYGYGPGKCPIAESFYKQALSLPLFPTMLDTEIEHVIQSVRAVLRKR